MSLRRPRLGKYPCRCGKREVSSPRDLCSTCPYLRKDGEFKYNVSEDGELLPLFVSGHEIEVERELERRGIQHEHQHRIRGTRYTVDFFLPYHGRTVLEVDGESHQSAHGQRRDAERDAVLRSLGYTVVRITNRSVESDVRRAVGQALDGGRT